MTTKGPSSDTLQLRRGTAAEWTAADPVLSAGEVGWERNTNKVKIGDGATAWTSLPYLAGTGVGVDHGVLSGLSDDDHPQYAALAQDEDVTGDWTFSGATVEVGDGTYIHGNVAGNGVRFTNSTNSFFTAIIDETGTLLLPVTGGNGGLTIGGDAHLWRNAAGVFKTDANLIIDGDLTAGFTTVDYLEIVEPGATDFAFDTYVVGDTQVRFIMDVSGKMAWGPGNTASDTNLYRSAANVLATNDTFLLTSSGVDIGVSVVRGTVGTAFYGGHYLGNFGGSLPVIDLYADSTNMGRLAATALDLGATTKIQWGTAIGTNDTNLYRSSANRLSTDDELRIFGAATTTPAFSTQVTGEGDARHYVQIDGKHFWGNTASWDTNLYRSAADILKTDDTFLAAPASGTVGMAIGTTSGVGVRITSFGDRLGALNDYGIAFYNNGTDANSRIQLQSDGSPDSTNGGIRWGAGGATAYDVNLYRSAANVLQTDDTLVVGATSLTALQVSGGAYVSQNLNFTHFSPYIQAANATDDFAVITGTQFMWFDDTRPGLYFGVDKDTSLYRSAADVLKTDDSIIAVGSVTGLGALSGVGVEAQTTGVSGSALQIRGTTGSRLWAFIPAATGTGLEAGAGGLSLYDGSAGSERLAFNTSGDVNIVNDTGQLLFGGAQDTNLYRSAADTLKTDDGFISTGGFAITGFNPAPTGYITGRGRAFIIDSAGYFGGSGATNDLYIVNEIAASGTIVYPGSAAGVSLKVRGQAAQSADLQRWETSTPTTLLAVDAAGKLVWESDTNLYRGAADQLKTDDNLVLNGGSLYMVGNIQRTNGQEVYLNFDYGDGSNALSFINRDNIANTVLRVQGMAGQTGVLQEWRSGTPTRLASVTPTGAFDFLEQAAPAAPAANTGRLFLQDDGSGKTQAVFRFPSGASQIIATEP